MSASSSSSYNDEIEESSRVMDWERRVPLEQKTILYYLQYLWGSLAVVQVCVCMQGVKQRQGATEKTPDLTRRDNYPNLLLAIIIGNDYGANVIKGCLGNRPAIRDERSVVP